jgi:hypothetical protein
MIGTLWVFHILQGPTVNNFSVYSSCKYKNSKMHGFPKKIKISENIGIFWRILKMGA